MSIAPRTYLVNRCFTDCAINSSRWHNRQHWFCRFAHMHVARKVASHSDVCGNSPALSPLLLFSIHRTCFCRQSRLAFLCRDSWIFFERHSTAIVQRTNQLVAASANLSSLKRCRNVHKYGRESFSCALSSCVRKMLMRISKGTKLRAAQTIQERLAQCAYGRAKREERNHCILYAFLFMLFLFFLISSQVRNIDIL